MKNRFAKVVMIAASLVLSASLAFAVEVKVDAPEATGAAKAAKSAGDKTKASAAAKDSAKAAKGAVVDTKAAAKGNIIDINTATKAELSAIPGVGDAYAAKIIAGRPYANKGQLKSRNILPGPVYEKVKESVIAKQIKK